ncbi:uncharacterized protein LOC142586934 isoform X2 [Dermacentor variabilis]
MNNRRKSSSTYVTHLAMFYIMHLSPSTAEEGLSGAATKLLRQNEPLFLLWGEEPPSSFSGRSCWQSTYHATGAHSTIQHTVKSNWNDPKPDHRKQHEAEVFLKMNSREGSTILSVEVQGTGQLQTLIQGDYDILYVDSNCGIIRPRNSETGVCTAWVRAPTTNFLHTSCRKAFVDNCRSCKPSTQSVDGSESSKSNDGK